MQLLEWLLNFSRENSAVFQDLGNFEESWAWKIHSEWLYSRMLLKKLLTKAIRKASKIRKNPKEGRTWLDRPDLKQMQKLEFQKQMNKLYFLTTRVWSQTELDTFPWDWSNGSSWRICERRTFLKCSRKAFSVCLQTVLWNSSVSSNRMVLEVRELNGIRWTDQISKFKRMNFNLNWSFKILKPQKFDEKLL